jgi:tetratricopeptide (TPR) repeat protein
MLRALVAPLAALAVVVAPTTWAGAQESGLDRLRAAARAAPRDYEAQRAFGLALLRAGRYREAEQQLTRAARLARGSLEALFDIARVSFARNDHAAAERACRALQRASKTAVLTQVCNARTDLIWNRSARAFEALEAALAQDPNHYEALWALGEAHRRRADVPSAEQAYERAIAARPNEAAPHLGLGRLYAAAGRRDDAVRSLRRAMELDPQNPEIQYELGRLLAGTEEGRQLLVRAVAGRPDWPEAQVAAADALLAAGQVEAAEAAYRAAIRMHDRNAPAHGGLGRALLARGDLAGAEASLRQALRLVPNDPQSAFALAEVLARTDRVEEAFEQFRHAADLDPRSSAPLLRAAEIAIALNRDVLASGFLDLLLQRFPDHPGGLALYGDVMRLRGDRARAREYYQRALASRELPDRARVEAALREVR